MIRTRIAPSPTGDPHVGTAYVALANYAFAKRQGGKFVLRIEDTDQARSTPESEAAILRSLRWLGISWDEGPDVGGPHAPYRQSQRSALYEKYARELLEKGDAFRCFCSAARLEEMRETQRLLKQPSRYDGHCLKLSADESERRANAGEPFVIRLKVPDRGSITVDDMRRGPTVFEWNAVDMQVLMKSDGLPTYHLANVVDDHLMEITHVIRGEEWISSAPKHLLLYQYFGWKPPVLMHLPLLRNPDRSKLSKRKNPTSILFYERMGYLPEALLNFLGLLLAPVESEHEELFGLDDLSRRLDFGTISLGGPVFDVAKLDWLNGHYIRKKSPAELEEAFGEWTYDRAALHEIVALAQQRIERLSDLAPLCAFLFAGRVAVSRETLLSAKIDAETARKALALAMWRLDDGPLFDKATIEGELRAVADELGVKFRDLSRLYYVAISGSAASLPLFDSMVLLGRDLCRERLRTALAELGGVSAAEQKAWRAA
ncbi:MAG: glutamate--tRNA ligase [Candidatus Eremiobacteraeota bacterium]|nr:glutamate--tRNA ligase [Candidatus Eremiobacteraeota bacterium]